MPRCKPQIIVIPLRLGVPAGQKAWLLANSTGADEAALQSGMATKMKISAILVLILMGSALGQAPTGQKQEDVPQPNEFRRGHPALDEIYKDESHCLALPEIRNDNDSPISCYCRDAIVEARYVYFGYLLPGKDANLSGIVLTLQAHATDVCGKSYDVYEATETKDWSWNGPEVVRTYPSEEVIQRISPEMKNGKPIGRWVPFTVQLVYRDAQEHVTRTENYASRELVPILPK